MPRLTAPRRQAEVCAPLPAAHAAARYARHLPERTLLYALVQAHYPDFIARIEAEGRSLPGYVREAFDAYLRQIRADGSYDKLVNKYYPGIRRYFPDFFNNAK